MIRVDDEQFEVKFSFILLLLFLRSIYCSTNHQWHRLTEHVYNISISSKSTLTFLLWTLEKFPEEKSEVCSLLLKWSSGTAGVTGDWLAVVIRIITCEDLRLLPYVEDLLLQIAVVIYLFGGILVSLQIYWTILRVIHCCWH